MSPTPRQRPRVGLLTVYFSLFDDQMPPDFRARQARVAELYGDALGRSEFEIVHPGLVASDEDGRRANAAFRAASIDVVVFAPVMAAPPSYAAHALEGIDAPVVIWNAPLVERLEPDLDQASAHEHTTTLAGIMLANVLSRAGKPPLVLTASVNEQRGLSALRDTVRAAVNGSSLTGGVLIRVGDPIAGYRDVETTSEELRRLALTEHSVDEAEFRATLAAVTAGEIAAVHDEVRGHGWSGEPDARSLRLAAALLALAERYGAIGGTVNCHGPLFRFSHEVGICACLGVSLATARGIPLSCTGDQPTAIALTLGRRLAGASLYCEFYTPELRTNLVLVANGGEGDPTWADGVIAVVPSQHYPGVHGRGSSLTYRPPAGQCTLLSVSPSADGWRGVWASAEITESRYRDLHAPNAMLRFPQADIAAALDAWAMAGATHHQALLPGDLSDVLPRTLALAGMTPVSAI